MNLHTHPTKGYRYRRPDGSYCYLGHDRAAAIEAAISANLHYAPKTSLYDKIVVGDSKSVAQLIADYVEQQLPRESIKTDTRKNREYDFGRIKQSDVGQQLVDVVTTRDLYLYLEGLPSAWTRQAYRARLREVFGWAICVGLRSDNPAAPIKRAVATRARQRFTLEEFNKVRELAPPWLRNAMDLGLQTLQRPGDVLLMRWDDVSEQFLRVVQRKTDKRLQLELSTPLRSVITRCRDNVVSPFLVHRLPEKLRPQHMRAKARVHHTQVLLEQADREFDEVRKRSGLYEENSNPPTLHEIRSLGAALYRESGWPQGRVQMLLGHTEAQTTRLYLEGHEPPWESVAAGLQLPGIRY